MHKAVVVLLLVLGVGACGRVIYKDSGSPLSRGGDGWPSERSSYGSGNPYQGGSSCNYQGSSGPVKGVRAYDRNRCCINTPAGRSCQ